MAKTGQAKGAGRLDAATERRIEAAINAVYMTREQPTLRAVMRHLRADCRTAGLPPSLKAPRARVSARILRDRPKVREGAATAGNQFRQVRPGLRTERPLQVVQIDHPEVDVMLVDDAIAAAVLDGMGRDGSAGHAWHGRGGPLAITRASFVEWLGGRAREWLRAAAGRWDHPVRAAFEGDI